MSNALTSKEKEQFLIRSNIVQNKTLELQMLQGEMQAFLNRLVKEKGLDETKTYRINENDEFVEVSPQNRNISQLNETPIVQPPEGTTPEKSK